MATDDAVRLPVLGENGTRLVRLPDGWLTSAEVDARREGNRIVLAPVAPAPQRDGSPSHAELWHGAAKDVDPVGRRAICQRFLAPFDVVAFDRPAAEVHGRLRYDLRHAPIGERDLFIAATALAHGHGVVTANVREFTRVPGLAVEDWTAG